jgi:hypothetical protein
MMLDLGDVLLADIAVVDVLMASLREGIHKHDRYCSNLILRMGLVVYNMSKVCDTSLREAKE